MEGDEHTVGGIESGGARGARRHELRQQRGADGALRPVRSVQWDERGGAAAAGVLALDAHALCGRLFDRRTVATHRQMSGRLRRRRLALLQFCNGKQQIQ